MNSGSDGKSEYKNTIFDRNWLYNSVTTCLKTKILHCLLISTFPQILKLEL